MVLAFKGMINTDYVKRGSSVNSQYIIESLQRVSKIFKQKRKETASQEWFLHWDTAPVHKVAVVQ